MAKLGTYPMAPSPTYNVIEDFRLSRSVSNVIFDNVSSDLVAC